MNKRVYVDASLLTAYYCPERDSALVQAYLTSGIDPVISRLTEMELVSILKKKIRLRELKPDQGRRVLDLFDSHLGTAFELLPVTIATLLLIFQSLPFIEYSTCIQRCALSRARLFCSEPRTDSCISRLFKPGSASQCRSHANQLP